ncbi:MAG: DTW domain-containing protein [Myxococcales bacterium]|nr:DTW domain-containing protein [Myxococcales bacterium]
MAPISPPDVITSALDWVRERVTPLSARTRVLILQHPQEQDVTLGTAPLLAATLPKAVTVRVGLSWPSFAACLGEDDVDPAHWVVLYPGSLKRALTPEELASPVVLLDRAGQPLAPGARVDGVVVLDGTWSQAKTLWWRNAWMLKLGRAVLHPREPGIYGKLRKEPRREAVSTLEAVAEVLVANGEPEGTRDTLRKLMRTMVQRARDARKTAPKAAAPGPATDEGDDVDEGRDEG